jgi:hypothetical protein
MEALSPPWASGVTHLLGVVARQAPILFFLALVLLILAGGGSSFGLPDLFWNGTIEDPSHSPSAGRLVTGLAVGLFLSEAIFVGLLIESRERGWTEDSFRKGLLYLSLILALLFIAVWLWGSVAHPPSVRHRSFDARGGIVFPLAVLFGLGVLSATIPVLARGIPAPMLDWLRAHIPGLPSDPPLLRFHAAGAVLSLAAAVAYGVVLVLVRSAYPGFAICILLMFVVGLHGYVAYRFGAAHTVVYAFLVVAYALPERELAARPGPRA